MPALATAGPQFTAEAVSLSDGVEVSPCRPDGYDGVERCAAEEAEYWGVYCHLVAGGVEWVADYRTEAEAVEYAEYLVAHNERLRRYSVLRP